MSNGNREFKSDVFSMLMEDKENALSVYNALNGTSLTNADELEIHTLDKGVSLTIRNDAAFVVDAALSIYEHQSTVCPNMPVRNLIYYTTIVSKILKNKNIYGKKMITIPVPKFVVFYNGEQEQPEKYDMKLSDAFEKKTDNLELELVCKVYNINFGKNKELLERCRVLKEYMIFVDYVRKYHEEQGYDELEKAINKAIDRCIEEGVLANFLMENRAEVVKVTQLDYTFDRQITLERKDAKQEGKEEIAINMLMAQMPLEEIMKFTGLSIEKLQQLAKEMIIK
ncbi:MAG: hypothetical protein U0K86_00865 [Agathobacter sp.]|nr:hypothetical protein [Agathobacter sp.]